MILREIESFSTEITNKDNIILDEIINELNVSKYLNCIPTSFRIYFSEKKLEN